jgi:ABC-type transport system involved in multi-copper enzyme maturation permease subunit
MSTSVAVRLVWKDLYLLRWTVAASVLSGLAAIAIMPFGSVPAYVGGVSLICVIVILNIVLVMNAVVQERKDKILLFVLSLPVSTRQYVAAKMASNAIAFVGSWLVLTLAAVVVIDASALPNGILPFLLAVLTYLLLYYCVLLAVGTVTDSSGWTATVITIGNISINFLIPLLLGLPSIAAHRTGATAVWTRDITTLIVVELAAGAAAVLAAFYLRSRTSDFV